MFSGPTRRFRPPPLRASLIKRVLPRSLLGRSLMIIVTPLIVVQLISTWVFYDRHWESVTRWLANSLAGEIAIVIQHLRDYPAADNRAWILEAAQLNMDLGITLKPGALLPENRPAPGDSITERLLARALDEVVRRPYVIDPQSGDKPVLIGIQLPEGVLQVEVPRKRLTSPTTLLFVMWSAGSALVLFVVATIFMRNQVKPIRRLASAAESFGKGRDVADFRPAGATEVRQAAAAFARMRDRIRRQIKQRTEMLAGVSHDLRTPLTRMKLQLAMMPETPEIRDLRSDVIEMEKMVDEYLAFARGEGTERPTVTSLTALLEEVVQDAARNGTPVTLETDGELIVPVRPNAFKRCITNIVNNAVHHGSTVAVHAARAGNTIEITVDDDGPGIPADKRDDVFKPFRRLDASRNPETGGVGLGLTIARDIVRGHGGDVHLETAPLGGLRARLSLPV
ncbi:MAG TPA: ATP-binding protein [Alphaproteobacteria bacterium]|jgi:two-component system osmolarity sensor histidine kinase EnvZ|nr:ATP-binding protein [Alphaproteobacteria bacterium]